MNDLVARMMGHRVNENVPVPVAAKRRPNPREMVRRHEPQMRAAAAIMGMTEDVGMSIIPDDAEEIEAMTGTSGLKIKDQRTPKSPEREPGVPVDSQAEEEPEEVMTPKDILVAPDVTPELFTPIDPSDVPEPPQAAAPPQPQKFEAPAHGGIDPLEVLLGRRSTRTTPGEGQPSAVPQPENVVTAESVQAAVNVSLGVGVGDVLGRGRPMPDPTPANPTKIVEAMRSFVK